MIGRLKGRVDHRGEGHVILDVGGVGYVVHVSDRTLGALPREGEAAQLWTEMVVREDLLQLLGFLTLAERDWHRLLVGIQGVGAKASMAILGAIGPEGLANAVALGDWGAVKAAPGVGPKIAQRVVNELKGKAPSSPVATAVGRAEEVVVVEGAHDPGARAAALSALGNLGYAPADAARAVAEALRDDAGAGEAALIRAALKRLAPQ